MSLDDFEEQVFEVAGESPVCDIPFVRRRMPVSTTIRLPLTVGGFVEAFYNQRTGTTAFAVIQNENRVFGADNTGGWHVHPFEDPARHGMLSAPMKFVEFVTEIERHFGLGECREVNSSGK
jgi:hypothetical protein